MFGLAEWRFRFINDDERVLRPSLIYVFIRVKSICGGSMYYLCRGTKKCLTQVVVYDGDSLHQFPASAA